MKFRKTHSLTLATRAVIFASVEALRSAQVESLYCAQNQSRVENPLRSRAVKLTLNLLFYSREKHPLTNLSLVEKETSAHKLNIGRELMACSYFSNLFILAVYFSLYSFIILPVKGIQAGLISPSRACCSSPEGISSFVRSQIAANSFFLSSSGCL